MSQTLQDFYTTASSRGFSRDFQIRVESIFINGESLPSDYLNYVKTVSLPSRKVEINTITYNTVKVPVSTGISDFGNKDNYQISFWADQALEFRDWFYDRAEATDTPGTPMFPNTLGSNLIQISVLDDMLNPVYGCQLEGVTIKEVSDIKYTKEGTGKPQEFSVTFAYYRVSPYTGKVTDVNSNPGGFLGAIQDLTSGIKTVTQGVNAVRGLATAARGASNAIRGR